MNNIITVMRVFVLASIISVSGCSLFGLDDKGAPRERQEKQSLDLEIDQPDLDLKNVEWYVVTPENVDEVFAELKEEGRDQVLIALSDDGYQTLILNIEQIQNFALTQKDVIKAYKEYYEGKNEDKKDEKKEK